MEQLFLSRRKLLHAVAGSVALSFLASCGKDGRPADDPEEDLFDENELRATINQLNILSPTIVSTGATILPAISSIDEHVSDFFYSVYLQGMSESTTVEQLKALIAQDFTVGNIFYVDRWSMSHTELALCFLREGW